MPTSKDRFFESGPFRLTCVDWKNKDHRSSVAASLIRGVYTMGREELAAATTWWEFFHFECIHVIKHPDDGNIFGAIFKYKYPCYDESVSRPTHVIAFRGTIKKFKDLLLDAHLPFKGLHYWSSRYETAYKVVQELIAKIDYTRVWLTGHSLGAAIALQIGKDLAKKGTLIKTYLFNPPFYSMPLEWIHNEELKSAIRVTKTILTSGAYLVAKGIRKHKHLPKNSDPFDDLSKWIPNIFVNSKDHLSCGYIGYFENRERIKESNASDFVKSVAAKHTMTNMVCYALGRHGEPPHLVPSALLTRNTIYMNHTIREAHEISQWWKQHSHRHHKLYLYSGDKDSSTINI